MAAAEITYGSDDSGLVWGYRFDPGARAVPIKSHDAIDWLRNPDQEGNGEFIWLHFNLTNTASEKWLAENAGLPGEFFEAMHQGSRSTRIETAEDALIAVINDVLHDFAFEPSDISTLWVSVTHRTVISGRRKPLQSIERLHRAVDRGETFRSSVSLLTHLLRDQADILVKIVRDTVDHVDKMEDKLLADRLNYKRENLGSLRRVLVRLQRLLAPEPAALFRLLQSPPDWVTEEDTEELRQSTEEFSVVLNDMVSLQERIKLLQEEIAAHVNENNSRSLYVLTIVTVMALPINIIAGLLGMNVGGIPLAKDDDGFWIVVGIIVGFSVLVAWWVIRKHREN